SATRPPAVRVQIVDRKGRPIAGSSGFSSRARDAARGDVFTPAGAPIPVALLDGSGSSRVVAYPNAFGDWCMTVEAWGLSMCPAASGFEPLEAIAQPAGLSGTGNQLVIAAEPQVTAIKVVQ